MEIERVEAGALAGAALGDLARGGEGERVGAADHEGVEGQPRVERARPAGPPTLATGASTAAGTGRGRRRCGRRHRRGSPASPTGRSGSRPPPSGPPGRPASGSASPRARRRRAARHNGSGSSSSGSGSAPTAAPLRRPPHRAACRRTSSHRPPRRASISAGSARGPTTPPRFASLGVKPRRRPRKRRLGARTDLWPGNAVPNLRSSTSAAPLFVDGRNRRAPARQAGETRYVVGNRVQCTLVADGTALRRRRCAAREPCAPRSAAAKAALGLIRGRQGRGARAIGDRSPLCTLRSPFRAISDIAFPRLQLRAALLTWNVDTCYATADRTPASQRNKFVVYRLLDA